MDLRHLAYFATAAELGSISRAAAQLRTTQPSLTRQLRALEHELGAPLLQRSSRGVRTTAAGDALLQHYRRIATEIARIPEVLHAGSLGKEIVRVGLPPGLPSIWFLSVVEVMRDQHPSIEMDLADLSSSDQEQALRRSELDLAFMHHAPRDFHATHVLRQTLGIALRPDRRPEFGRASRLADLDGAWIIAPVTWKATGQAADLDAAARSAGISVRWRFRRFTEHVGLMASSAEADGILLTESSAGQFIPDWTWFAVDGAAGQPLLLDTFAVHHTPSMLAVTSVVQAAATVSPNPVADLAD